MKLQTLISISSSRTGQHVNLVLVHNAKAKQMAKAKANHNTSEGPQNWKLCILPMSETVKVWWPERVANCFYPSHQSGQQLLKLVICLSVSAQCFWKCVHWNNEIVLNTQQRQLFLGLLIWNEIFVIMIIPTINHQDGVPHWTWSEPRFPPCHLALLPRNQAGSWLIVVLVYFGLTFSMKCRF